MTDKHERDVAPSDEEARKELPPAKWQPGCLTYSIISLLLLLAVGWAANWFWARSEKSALDAKIKAMQDRGEPVWFADLAPDPLPAGRDGFRRFQAARASFEDVTKQNANLWASFEQTHLTGTGTGGTGVMDAYGAADIANFRQVLTAASPFLELLQGTLERGTVHWPHDFSTQVPFALLLEDVQLLRGFSRVVKAQGLVAIADSDSDAAISAIDDLLRVADLMRDEPFLVSHLVRVSIANQAVALTTGLMESHNLSSQQRQELDRILQTVEANYGLRDCYIAERGAILTTIASIQDTDDFSAFVGLGNGQGVGWWVYGKLPALQYRDMAKSIHFFDQTIEFIDETGPEATAQLEQLEQEIAALSDTYLMTKLTLPSTMSVRNITLQLRQKLRGLRIALRVDQAFRETGQMPVSLQEVIDDSMPEIPLGTLSNLLPAYRTTNSGFQIYDLGTNGTDDGGGGDKDEADSLIQITYPPVDDNSEQPSPSQDRE